MSITANEYPLVSVIVRSIGRTELAAALNSIAGQSYPNIEVVVVDALGRNHPMLNQYCGQYPLRVVSCGAPLKRSAAANFGLDHAWGKFIIFLDDDDYFGPSHIAKLAGIMMQNADAHVVYTGVALVSAAGTAETGVNNNRFNNQFNALNLLHCNYIAINAVLFGRYLLEAGCRFDVEMEIYEDWDFWIQLSMQTPFIHFDGISAYYRCTQFSSGAGAGTNVDEALKEEGRAKIYEKWKHVRTKLADTILSLQKQGLQLHRSNQLSEAHQVCDKILSIQPDNLTALNLLGMINYHRGQFDVAMELIGRALLINDQVAGLHLNYGLVLQGQDRQSDAIVSYRRALELDPQNSAIQAKLATIESPQKS